MLGVFLWGCSGSGGNGDAGPGDGQDGTDQTGDDHLPPDTDLGDDFGLIIPPGTRACAIVYVSESNWAGSCSKMARVSFRSGVFRLSRSDDSFDLDLFDKIEWGAGPHEVSPTLPGSVSRTLTGDEQNGIHQYLYTQRVTQADSSFSLTLRVSFEVENGSPVRQTLTVDEQSLSDQVVKLMGMCDDVDTGYLGSCLYTEYACRVHEYEFENGEVLKIEPCSYCPSGWICKSSNGGVKKAVFTNGQGSQTLDDYFQAVLSWRHHDWGGDVLVIFEEPQGQAHGLYLGTSNYPDLSFEQVHYLDADLNAIETKSVVRHDKDVGW